MPSLCWAFLLSKLRDRGRERRSDVRRVYDEPASQGRERHILKSGAIIKLTTPDRVPDRQLNTFDILHG